MRSDAFSKYHPAVNCVFFLGAICCGVVICHPAYLVPGVLSGALYYRLLHGRKGRKFLLRLIPLFLFLTAINPLFNTSGAHVLFSVFGRPYTLEALYYGAVVAGMFVGMTIWFGCCNQVLTSDKFTCLFGNIIPALSLLIVMVLRLVPAFIRRIRMIGGARSAIGKGIAENAGKKEKVIGGLSILGAMTSWALEGSVVTGDSMRARGYGTAKRATFLCYRMRGGDWILTAVEAILLALVIVSAVGGQTTAEFTPTMNIAPVSWGAPLYGAYLLLPSVLHFKEAVSWHISRSRI